MFTRRKSFIRRLFTLWTYKAKINVLTDAVLSKAVADYVNEKWGGAITCDSSSQIDLR